ncbi:tyrosine recombinase XerD [Planctopirus limnophila DSM 3776]|uniref:Tyrosine recombinase XerC n=1 Tax=Planctopirus limnophila (strain ATCC 43296 / DSM 3776 / IFAM 1008 / Mu 290) TaxID=521674 RepID=D5SU35_PLAL2|nr:site-specific tyrosine recombinase XerD [Planctopirus limnophila]ADG67020.1 tyrosine recombinase XerD [Planctopirus limnophila DSM 3776]
MPPRFKPVQNSVASALPTALPSTHVEGFVAYLQGECGLARNTVISYERDIKRFSDWFHESGVVRVTDITLQDLSGYLRYLHELKLATSTIARHLVSLKMFFRYLMLEGILKESVADLLNSPKLWEHLPKVLSEDAVNRLLDAPMHQDLNPYRDRALLAVLYATGCRASEVCSLKMRDLQLDEGFCRCVGKGNKERLVSLNPVAVSALKTYLARERPARAGTNLDSPVFTSRSGRSIDRIQVWKLVKRYASRIGLSDAVTPHTLRHSFATHMLANGAEIRALQELLGHASIRTTQIYTHVEHSRLKAIHKQCHPRG